ncbi:MAG: RNA polymerase sigma factor [Thiotrichales bacterium]
MKDRTDWQLIREYLDNGRESAIEILVKRHYDSVYKRLLAHCKHPDDAADLAQQLWIRVINNIPNYKDDGQFPAFLMTAVRNIVTDYWRRRGVRNQVIQDHLGDDDANPIDLAPDQGADTARLAESREQLDYLIHHLVPSLDCQQRLVFLLVHESEHWETSNRLGWNHLAELNGIDEETAWQRFEQARNQLLTQSQSQASGSAALDCDALLVFLVWTQAQRLRKETEFTWDYFATILGTSANTLKTRYRAALKKLATGLDQATGEA